MRVLTVSLVLMLLAGCVAVPPTAADKASAALQFVDLERFDHELTASLKTPLPRVEVSFYDRIAPSKLPERVQTWMAAVEEGGGKVRVTPPAGSVSAKNPMLVIGAISALWQGQKVAREMSAKMALRAAHGYDAELVLRQEPGADVVVDRIVFLQRPR